MTFESILFYNASERLKEREVAQPDFFADLNLDQIVDAVTGTRRNYDLKPFFYIHLNDIEAIKYRQEVMKDLEAPTLSDQIRGFSRGMRQVRAYLQLIDKLFYKYHKEGWFLEAASVYCETLMDLRDSLTHADLKSRGLASFREYIASYIGSDAFASLRSETIALKTDLAGIEYCVIIKDGKIKVRKYESEIDYSADVEATFEKFKQAAVKDYRINLPEGTGMDHIEAQILDFVTKLYPEVFARLDKYCAQYAHFVDETVAAFDREVQFFLAWLEYLAKFKEVGLPFCYPRLSKENKEVYGCDTFDLALADKLVSEHSSVVCNDFYLKGPERIFVVSGPNQGGKTTFARTFGQMHYLACLGCPVPGKEAQLFLYDKLFTHFEKEENVKNLHGKLQDDLIRIHHMIQQSTSQSIFVLNEIFTSTTLRDGVFLSKKIIEKIMELDALCVCVTFMDELASLSEKTVSMVSTVAADNPAIRTYKILRKPADGLSYAILIAEKYRLTYDHLMERLP